MTQELPTCTIRIPTPLRVYTGREPAVLAAGATVAEALAHLVATYPPLRPHLVDADGTLRGYINLYLNSRDIRGLQGIQTPLSDGDRLAITPAIAGGSSALRDPYGTIR